MTSPIIKFLPYQRAWIEDQSRFKIGMFTRRGGKTFGASGEIVADCTQAEIDGRKVRWTILSRSENTAKEALEDALKPMTRAYYAVVKGLSNRGQPSFDEGEFHVPAHVKEVRQGDRTFMIEVPEARFKTQEVHFPGGSRVVALSASPDAARGFGGNLLLDEFAFHADSRRIWGSAFPVAARGGHKIRVISTPNGKGNKFYELMTTADNGWSKHRVDIYDAVRQGLDINIDELRSGMADEDAWAQEFELAWLDEASSWLDYDLISACEHTQAGIPELYAGGPCFVGVDIAARNDLFVIWVMELVGDVLWTREIIAKKRISFAEQDQLLAKVMKRYRVVRVRMDQTGMGEKPVEDAKRNHGQDRVEGVLFTSAAKLDMATKLKESMQDRKSRLPAGDPVLRSDLHSIKSQVGVTGIRRLVADGDSDGHADRFWAGAMAVSAADMGEAEYGYQGVPGARSRFARPDQDNDDEDSTGGRWGAAGGGMVMLVDQFGRPLQRTAEAELLERHAIASVGSVRRIETGHPADGLDPRRLTRILREAETGDATAYLELAEQMEEKDLHYSAVLGVRKRAIRSLTLQVDPGGKDGAADEAADMVRTALTSTAIRTTLIDMMDAIGKGYSACEILWERDGKSGLKVAGLDWVDQRWFEFDRTNGNHLYLRDNAGPQPLWADCFVIHLAKTKSGLPIRGGLARLASWAYLFKNFTVKDWSIFCEAYGHPLRLGKYDSSASIEDRRTLLRAVRQIGVDMAAIIPKTMEVEIIKAAAAGAETLYEGSARFWDEQISKGVLGQVATTDAIAGGHAVGKIHEEVRSDIRDADAEQLAATLERDIAAAIVRVNFRPDQRVAIPKVSFVSPERADPKLMMELLEKGPKAGLKISVRQVRKVFALEEPEAGDEILTPPVPPPALDLDPTRQKDPAPPSDPAARIAASVVPGAGRDSIDRLIDELIAEGGMQRAMGAEIGTLFDALARARDMNDVNDILDAFRAAPPGPVQELLTQSTYAARLAGETGAETRD